MVKKKYICGGAATCGEAPICGHGSPHPVNCGCKITCVDDVICSPVKEFTANYKLTTRRSGMAKKLSKKEQREAIKNAAAKPAVKKKPKKKAPPTTTVSKSSNVVTKRVQQPKRKVAVHEPVPREKPVLKEAAKQHLYKVSVQVCVGSHHVFYYVLAPDSQSACDAAVSKAGKEAVFSEYEELIGSDLIIV